MHSPILAPVVALVAWTLIMQIWMYAARFGGMRRAGVSLEGRVGTRGNALDGVLPDRDNWKAHNYNHLMEQPTIFYAVALSLALLGFGGAINLYLAWGYVACRVIHSLIQATVNVVTYRFLVFTLGTLCLIGLTVHAAVWLIHHG